MRCRPASRRPRPPMTGATSRPRPGPPRPADEGGAEPPAPAASASPPAAEPASPNGATTFEELDGPASPALVRAAEEEEITADHATVDPDATEAYDPFAATDDELPPWERDDQNKRD